jgi:hypothetical protein
MKRIEQEITSKSQDRKRELENMCGGWVVCVCVCGVGVVCGSGACVCISVYMVTPISHSSSHHETYRTDSKSKRRLKERPRTCVCGQGYDIVWCVVW